jgi:hypothetical protein
MSISPTEINVNHKGDYLAEFVAEAVKPTFRLLKPSELFSLPPRQMLVENLLAVGDLIIPFSEPGLGKTAVVHDLAACCISGQTFAGEFDIPSPLTVLYCAGEGGAGLSARLKAAFSRHNITAAEEDRLVVSTSVPQLFAPHGDGMAQLIDDYKAARGDKLDILIIDTLHSASYSANENSSQDAGVMLREIKLAQRELNCAVILVHHAGKGGNGERGSTAFRGAADGVWEIARDGKRLVFRCSKAKDLAPFPDLSFSLIAKGDSVIPLWHGKASQMKSDGKSWQRKVIDYLTDNPGWKQANVIADGIGNESKYIYQLLETMCKTGEIQRFGNGKPYIYALVSQSKSDEVSLTTGTLS